MNNEHVRVGRDPCRPVVLRQAHCVPTRVDAALRRESDKATRPLVSVGRGHDRHRIVEIANDLFECGHRVSQLARLELANDMGASSDHRGRVGCAADVTPVPTLLEPKTAPYRSAFV
jgi:hypothetical protein